MLSKILSISGDIMYDINKKTIIIRGMSLGYNMALLALICQYVKGQITWYQIIESNLVHMVTDHRRLESSKFQQRNLKIIHKYCMQP